MITKPQIRKIRELKLLGYSQLKVAEALNISRSTVQRHWKGKRIKPEDVFAVGKCPKCGTEYPMPKFLPYWNCPVCNKWTEWKKSWFGKEEESTVDKKEVHPATGK